MRKLTVSAALAVAVLVSGALPSRASVILDLGAFNLGNTPQTVTLARPANGGETGAFVDDYTFSISQSIMLTSSSVTNSFGGDTSAFINGLSISLFSGVPNTGSSLETALASTIVAGTQFGGLAPLSIGPGSYYVEIAGTVNGGTAHYGGSFSISPVPEPSTWAMMILGFAGVGFMAYRRKASFRLA